MGFWVYCWEATSKAQLSVYQKAKKGAAELALRFFVEINWLDIFTQKSYLIKMKKSGSSLKHSLLKSSRSLLRAFPLILGVVILMGLFRAYIPTVTIKNLFRGNVIVDTLAGAVAGSIFAGHSSTSYILGGELFRDGISLFAVLAFIIAWDTIGLTQMPLEISYFGKKFTILRNIFCFIFSILVAVFVTLTLNIL